MKKHLHNILAVGGSDVLSRLLGFATNAYLARILGASSFGIMSIGFSVLSYVAMLSSPGLHIQGTRAVAVNRETGAQYMGSVNSLRLILATGAFALVTLGATLFVESHVISMTIIIFSLSALPIALSLDWYFQGKENLVVYSGSKVIVALVYFAMTIALVHHETDVVRSSVSFLVANMMAALWLMILFTGSGMELSFLWRPSEWRLLLRSALPLGISSFLAQTIMNLPVLIIGLVRSSHDAGLFNAAMKLIFAAMLIDRVFYSMFFPVIARLRNASDEHFRKTVALALKVVLAIAIPIVVAGVVCADSIVVLVYGQAFSEAAWALRFLLFYFLASVINTVMMCAMLADNRESDYVRVMAAATALLVVLCIALSFASGASGAAAAVAIGESVMAFLLYFKGQSLLQQPLKTIAPSCIAGSLMLGVLLLLNALPIFVALPAAALVFVGALWLLRGFSKDEYTFVRERFV